MFMTTVTDISAGLREGSLRLQGGDRHARRSGADAVASGSVMHGSTGDSRSIPAGGGGVSTKTRGSRPVGDLPGGMPALALMCAILLGLEWILPGEASLAHLRLHPGWIPVLLIVAQHGTASGIIAVAMVSVVAWLAGLPEQYVTEDYFAYFLRVALEPILWLGAVLVLGEIRQRDISDRGRLEDALTESERQSNAIGAYCQQLLAHSESLERRIATVGQGGSDELNRLSQALRDVAGSAPTAIAETFRRGLNAVLGPVVASVYFVRDGRLVRAQGLDTMTSDGEAEAAVLLPPDELPDALFTRLVERRSSVSLFDPDGAEMLGTLGVAAVPMEAHGCAMGAVLLTYIEPARIDGALGPKLRVLGDALALALGGSDTVVAFPLERADRGRGAGGGDKRTRLVVAASALPAE
jgi:hypothetical protein